MLRDVTYTFWLENRVQDCAVRPVAVAVGRRKWYGPLSWQRVVDRRGQRWKDMWEQQSSIRIWAGTRLHLTSALRASVRTCLVRPASSCWIVYILHEILRSKCIRDVTERVAWKVVFQRNFARNSRWSAAFSFWQRPTNTLPLSNSLPTTEKASKAR